MRIELDEVPVGSFTASVVFDVDYKVRSGKSDSVTPGWCECELFAPTIHSITVYDDDGNEMEVTDWHRQVVLEWFDDNQAEKVCETVEARGW